MNETTKAADAEAPALAPPATETALASPAPSPPATGLLAWVGRSLPTLLVFTLLVGLGVWGHQTGWTLPRFSALTGKAAEAEEDWCAEHSVPESICVECNPELLPQGKSFGWCKVHGVHECPLEHPGVAQLPSPPVISQADLDRAQRALDFAERTPNDPRCKLQQRRIQFTSQEAFVKSGIEVTRVTQAPVAEAASGYAEVKYEPTKLARVTTPVEGKLWRITKEIGQPVKKGEVVALVEAIEIGKAKTDLLKALAELDLANKIYDRLAPLLAQGAITEAKLRELEAEKIKAQISLTSAQKTLENYGLPVPLEEVVGLAADKLARRVQLLGLPEEVVAALDPQTIPANLLPLRAPLDGQVVARPEGVAGEVVDTSRVLLLVADVRHMLLTLSVSTSDAKRIRRGQPVRFQPDGGGREARGEVDWVSPAADERTRRVEVRARLANPDGALRANAFGAGQVILRAEKKAVVVPSEAVHWENSCHVVFVRDKNWFKDGAPKVFHVRTVRPGARDGQNTEIIAGVLPGEVVATRNSGILRGELLKNSLGAG